MCSLPFNPIKTWIAPTRKSQVRFTCFVSIMIFTLKLGLQIILHYFHGEKITFEMTLFYESALIAYALWIWLFVFEPLFEKVIRGLKEVIQHDSYYHLMKNSVPPANRHRGLLFGITSGVIGVVLYDLPKLWEGDYLEAVVIHAIIDLIVFALLGFLVYTAFAEMRLLTSFLQHVKITNIFNANPFRPIGEWSLSVSLAIIGGITINLLFLKESGLKANDQIVYVLFLVAAGTIFFIGMRSTHHVMSENKKREIDKVDEALIMIHKKLLMLIEKGKLEGADPLFSTASKLDAHKTILEKADEWPYTVGNIRS
jgi:hypothetical protein